MPNTTNISRADLAGLVKIPKIRNNPESAYIRNRTKLANRRKLNNSTRPASPTSTATLLLARYYGRPGLRVDWKLSLHRDFRPDAGYESFNNFLFNEHERVEMPLHLLKPVARNPSRTRRSYALAFADDHVKDDPSRVTSGAMLIRLYRPALIHTR
ncbi:hypothetical protein NA57DRAFT_75779 [Rhizodiscina lignyota]|uniref:Uncharacterized protein n=1 Tax=Rhizodiscina lignyota TaxID=1504668 RepID=A0A9P4IG51_9PEZI|nr:hypothetical protein NA57DRAFT_75779 [Rhizodiscina lignyota]